MAGQTPTPLFQEWFCLNRNIDSHFVDLKSSSLFSFFVVKASTRGEDIVFCVGFRVSAIFFLKIFT